MRKAISLVLACIIILCATATSQTRNRRAPRRSASAARAAEKSATEIKAGRQRVAAQIKTLTRFLYLLGGITKEIASADQAASSRDASPSLTQQNEANKRKVKESIRNVREGLDKLETDFRLNPTLKNYYPYLAGVAAISEAAETQAAANRFDEAGRSLLNAVGKLADALAAMR